MADRMSTISADTNCQMNSEFGEIIENFGPTHSTQSTYENDIRKSLKILNKYYRSFCCEFEGTLQKSILNCLSLESKLAQAEELKQVHFSNVASCGERSTEEAEHVQNMSISSHTSNGTRQLDIDQTVVVVSDQSLSQAYKDEIGLHQNLLAEVEGPIYMLKENIRRVHREVLMRLQSYFRNNKEDKEKQKHKTIELEENLFQAIRAKNYLQDKNQELELKLKKQNDKLKEFELNISSQQMSPAGDQVEYVHTTGTHRSTNVLNALDDLHTEVNQYLQSLESNEKTSQQRSTLEERNNNGFISSKQRLFDAYRHLLVALQSNQELGNELKRFKELNEKQLRRISELEKIRVNIQRENASLGDLVEAFEEELALKNNQLKCQKDTLANIQGKLKSAEDELNQLRRSSIVGADSTVQVLSDLQANEVSETTPLEYYSEELPECRQHQNSSTLLVMDDMSNKKSNDTKQCSLNFNQSNEPNEADSDGTNTTVVSHIVLDQKAPDLTIFHRNEEEMQNEIINLKEHSTLLEQMLVDAEEMNHKLREDLVKSERKTDDTIETLHRLNDNLREDLDRKNIKLDIHERNIADLQEQLELAEQKCGQPIAELEIEYQAPPNTCSQTQRYTEYPDERIERLDVKSVEQDFVLDELKQFCEASDESLTPFANLAEGNKANPNSRSKIHWRGHAIMEIIKE